MTYDPESTIQDADIEMEELRRAAKHDAYLIKIGKCRHGWTGPHDKKPAPLFVCYNCGHEFKDRDARDAFHKSQYAKGGSKNE